MEKEKETAVNSSLVRHSTKLCAFLGISIILSYIFTSNTQQFDNYTGMHTVIRYVRDHSELITDLQ